MPTFDIQHKITFLIEARFATSDGMECGLISRASYPFSLDLGSRMNEKEIKIEVPTQTCMGAFDAYIEHVVEIPLNSRCINRMIVDNDQNSVEVHLDSPPIVREYRHEEPFHELYPIICFDDDWMCKDCKEKRDAHEIICPKCDKSIMEAQDLKFEEHKATMRRMLRSKRWDNPFVDGLKWHYAARTFHKDTPSIFEHLGNCWIYRIKFNDRRYFEKFTQCAKRHRLRFDQGKLRRFKHAKVTSQARDIQRALINWTNSKGWTDIAFLSEALFSHFPPALVLEDLVVSLPLGSKYTFFDLVKETEAQYGYDVMKLTLRKLGLQKRHILIENKVDLRTLWANCLLKAERDKPRIRDKDSQLENLRAEKVSMKRVDITPFGLRMTLQDEGSCRLFRKPEHDPPRFFARSSCKNENGDLFPLQKAKGSGCIRRIHEIYMGGELKIGGLTYDWLFSSDKQVKSMQGWLYARNDKFPFTADQVRPTLGNLEKIKNPSKLLSRMALWCSTGYPISGEKSYTRDEIQIIDKILAEDGTELNDGHSLIEYEEFNRLLPKIKMRVRDGKFNSAESKYHLSAFQGKVGGCKGMFSQAPKSFSEKYPGKKLFCPPSAFKYEADDMMLEVHKEGGVESFPANLNHSIIQCMKAHGADDKTFFQLQGDYHKLLREAAQNLDGLQRWGDTKLGAKKFLQRRVRTKTSNQHWRSLSKKDIREKIMKDVEFREQLQQDWGKALTKGHILLPYPNCRIKGICDYHGILKPGEVFIKLKSREGLNWVCEFCGARQTPAQKYECSSCKSLKEPFFSPIGDVSITRDPLVHPGSFRKVKCVKPWELWEFYHGEILVFPTQGETSIPNQLGGGDLDGDSFFLCFHKELQAREDIDAICPVMEWDTIPEKKWDTVTFQDCFNFYIRFQQEDNLSTVAMVLKAVADQEEENGGMLSPKCIELAKIHSINIDFAKKDIIKPIPDELKVAQFPSFMNTNGYNSKSILGRLFAKVNVPMHFRTKEVEYWLKGRQAGSGRASQVDRVNKDLRAIRRSEEFEKTQRKMKEGCKYCEIASFMSPQAMREHLSSKEHEEAKEKYIANFEPDVEELDIRHEDFLPEHSENEKTQIISIEERIEKGYDSFLKQTESEMKLIAERICEGDHSQLSSRMLSRLEHMRELMDLQKRDWNKLLNMSENPSPEAGSSLSEERSPSPHREMARPNRGSKRTVPPVVRNSSEKEDLSLSEEQVPPPPRARPNRGRKRIIPSVERKFEKRPAKSPVQNDFLSASGKSLSNSNSESSSIQQRPRARPKPSRGRGGRKRGRARGQRGRGLRRASPAPRKNEEDFQMQIFKSEIDACNTFMNKVQDPDQDLFSLDSTDLLHEGLGAIPLMQFTNIVAEFLGSAMPRVEALVICESFWRICSLDITQRFRQVIIEQTNAIKYDFEEKMRNRSQETWTCFCTTINDARRTHCTTCGTRRGDEFDIKSQQHRV